MDKLNLIFVLCIFGVVHCSSPGLNSNEIAGSNNPAANFPHPAQFDFDGFFKSFDSLRKYHEQFLNNGGNSYSYSRAASTPNGRAQAQSSLTFSNNGLQENIIKAHKVAAANGGVTSVNNNHHQQVDSYGNPVRDDYGAFSGASFGPNGGHQIAEVFPESSAFPNVNVHTSFEPKPGNGNSYHYSVSSASASHSTNINGKTDTVQEAKTVINDNGKVTTYTAKNP